MLITRVAVLYTCRRCGRCYTIRFTPITLDLEEIIESMEKYKLCVVCSGSMMIEKATFETIKSKCGNDRFGSWQCDIHRNLTYYPILLRKAIDHTLLIDYVGQRSLQRYNHIAKAGYPWKCPICNKEMKYISDNVEQLI